MREGFGAVLDWVAFHASIITAIAALCALTVAWKTLAANRDIARRRAALDFFLKTEMDAQTFKMTNEFRAVTADQESLKTLVKSEGFTKTKEYADLIAFLNVCELMAVGVDEGVMSEAVTYRYWGPALKEAHVRCQVFLDFLTDRDPATYIEFRNLVRKWETLRP